MYFRLQRTEKQTSKGLIMKKYIVCVSILVSFAWGDALFAATQEDASIQPTTAAGEKPTLRVLNWSEYIDLDDDLPADLPIAQRSPTLREFAEQNQCNVEYFEFDEFTDMVSQFLNLPGFYDIMVVTCGNTRQILSMDWLLPIPEDQLPNLRYIDASARTPPPDPEGQYLIPFLCDYTGLLFRSDRIDPEQVTWKNYFNPPKEWKEHIGVFDSPPVMFAAAAIANGIKDYGQAGTKDIQYAQRTLLSLLEKATPSLLDQPDVMREALVTGDIWIMPAYSPDANFIVEADPSIQFVIPPEGAEYYRDYMVVHRESQNPDLAFAFVNHILDPEVSGRISAYLGANVPSAEARKVQVRIDPFHIPSPMDVEGRLVPGMQITYDMNPEIQALWLEALEKAKVAEIAPDLGTEIP